MIYPHYYSKMPRSMQVGSKVGVVGEGETTFIIKEIAFDFTTKNVKKIFLEDENGNNPGREPLSKIYLKNTGEFVFCAIGECDICHAPITDSDTFVTTLKNNVLCSVCYDDGKYILRSDYAHI